MFNLYHMEIGDLKPCTTVLPARLLVFLVVQYVNTVQGMLNCKLCHVNDKVIAHSIVGLTFGSMECVYKG